ncbi:glutathione S-transferase family protein [uncultured Alsobacter sp.]|uniref:glutathione S-transferase family protein n=1 Tax=uncultured Alsobacter sp. TaxID=1748258 RepID=UPI0025D61FE7|nr:glutathione S-transferase family protein [uncultured Alsobacter sp.]
MADHELIGSKGCGSAIVEMAFDIAGIPCRVTDLPYLEPGAGRDRLLALNPLGQVPTLVLPDGTVLTESAAMILHAAESAPDCGLAPPPASAARSRFLNELIVLVAAVYPTFTFADDPGKFGLDGDAAVDFKAQADGRRLDIFRQIDARITGPYWLGESLSALDLYLVALTRWRPGRPWFEANVPRVVAAARAAERHPKVAAVVARHFD